MTSLSRGPRGYRARRQRDLDPPTTVTIVAPHGNAIVADLKAHVDGTLVKALARAWRWQRMLDQGLYATVREIGDAEKISKSYVSRILRLALLAPDIVDAILSGRTDQGMVLERPERPLPASWGRSSAPSFGTDLAAPVRRSMSPELKNWETSCQPKW